MSKRQKIAVDIDADTLAGLDRLAAEWGCTREHVLAAAVSRFADEELRHRPPDPDNPSAKLPPYGETDPLARKLDEAERRAGEAFEAYMKPAEDDIAAGRVVDHDDFMRDMRERYRSRSAA